MNSLKINVYSNQGVTKQTKLQLQIVTQGELTRIPDFATAERINEIYKQNKKNNSIFEVVLRCICSNFEESDYYTVLATILRTF